MASIALAGAGIAGLAAAHRLEDTGHDITVFESSQRAGGAIHSERVDGYLVEWGPNTIQSRGGVLESLIGEIGLKDEQIEASPAAKKRYVVRDGKPVPVPAGPLSFLSSPLLSPAAKFRIAREPFNRRTAFSEDESVADFVRRRFGQEVLDYAVNPFLAGVYAGDPEELSLRHTFPILHDLEQAHGSVIGGQLKRMRKRSRADAPKPRSRMFSFKDGLEMLPDVLAQHLGDRIHFGAALISIEQGPEGWTVCVDENGAEAEHRFDAVILALPLHRLSEVEIETWMDLTPLREVVYAPVSVVALGYRTESVGHPLDGFGMLVPERELDFQILGTLFSSTLFPGRAPSGQVLLTSFVGGMRHPHLARQPDDVRVGLVHRDLSRLLDIEAEPVFTRTVHHPHAIPQYQRRYGLVQQTIARLEQEHPGLYLAGSFRAGVSVADTAASGIAAAEAAAKHLS